MLIGPGEGLTPFDIMFFRSRIKVTRVTFVKKKWFPLIFLRTIYHRAFIFHVLWEGKTPIHFGFTMSKVKVTMVIFVTNHVNMFLFLILRTV